MTLTVHYTWLIFKDSSPESKALTRLLDRIAYHICYKWNFLNIALPQLTSPLSPYLNHAYTHFVHPNPQGLHAQSGLYALLSFGSPNFMCKYQGLIFKHNVKSDIISLLFSYVTWIASYSLVLSFFKFLIIVFFIAKQLTIIRFGLHDNSEIWFSKYFMVWENIIGMFLRRSRTHTLKVIWLPYLSFLTSYYFFSVHNWSGTGPEIWLISILFFLGVLHLTCISNDFVHHK